MQDLGLVSIITPTWAYRVLELRPLGVKLVQTYQN